MKDSNVTPFPKEINENKNSSLVSSLSPREIVSELDRYVVGQNKAKKAVAIALRNRWRRQALKGEMKDEVLPKNILMIGPTGVGKTEISRRLSKLAEAPFVKVEATRFTEVGYVGRDVEQIIRDLLEIAIAMEKIKKRKEVYTKAQKLAEEKVLDAVVGNKASLATRESFRKRLRDGDLDNNEIEIAVNDSGSQASFEIPGMPGANIGMINIGEMIGRSVGNKQKKKKKMTVKESHEILINDEADKLIEEDKIIKSAKDSTENNGIVFLDEIDKISGRTDRSGGDVSREGVQRDLLPLIEGTTVSTKYGAIKTDHILFIASGAFQLAKPSDLLPELQGRLPIRVELEALTSDDFKRILKEPDYSLIKQYVALLKTENVELEFSEDGIDAIANMASEVNNTVENIGARRLHTIIERILDDISFTATDRAGEKIVINSEYVKQNLDELVKDTDLSKFIL
jgi:ATP-dependent HslUV protease ATP-binding subunit HslU